MKPAQPLAILLGALASAACALFAPQPTPTHFAVLASVEELADSPAVALGVTTGDERVGLGPVTLPDYLDRLALVSRRDGTTLVPSDTESWSEPLDRAVERVLAIDLRHVLGVGHVVAHPWYATDRPDVEIEIAFSRFESDGAGRVIVAASWSLRRLDGSAPRIERETRIERPAGHEGAEIALALSRALVDLCRDIARAWPAAVPEEREPSAEDAEHAEDAEDAEDAEGNG